MLRYIFAAALLALAPVAHAQHATSMTSPHAGHGSHMPSAPDARTPTQPGQAAFAAIQEIVAMLDADPATDWSTVDIEALRRHLVDMDNVTLRATAKATWTESGATFVLTGPGSVADSIRRMVRAHAETMNGTGGMFFQAKDHPQGAVLEVTVADPAMLPKLRGLGFIGVMALGAHHQAHHLMIATGHGPHR